MGYDMIRYEQKHETRMQILSEMTSEQFCALPEGTEVLFFKVAPFGIGIHIEGVDANEANREGVRRHSREEHDGQEYILPYDVAIYLLPEDFVPDISEIISKKFIELGTRHGKEGAFMLSESALKNYAGDDWNDEAYPAYVKAYRDAVGGKR